MKLDLQKLKELEATAWPGPWEIRFNGNVGLDSIYSQRPGPRGCLPTEDAQLVVEMRNQLPALIARIEKLEAENSRLFHAERLKAEEADRLHDELAACMGLYESVSETNRILEAENQTLRKERDLLKTVVEDAREGLAAYKAGVHGYHTHWEDLEDALAALDKEETE